MANESQDMSPVFRIDVGQSASESSSLPTRDESEKHSELTALLQHCLLYTSPSPRD